MACLIGQVLRIHVNKTQIQLITCLHITDFEQNPKSSVGHLIKIFYKTQGFGI